MRTRRHVASLITSVLLASLAPVFGLRIRSLLEESRLGDAVLRSISPGLDDAQCSLVPRGWEGILEGTGNVSLAPRSPGDLASRPVGFPSWGSRTLVLEEIGTDGLADRCADTPHRVRNSADCSSPLNRPPSHITPPRLYHFKFALLLGRLLGANVSLPRPCEVLSSKHSSSIVSCDIGWDRYFSTRGPFDGYVSNNGSAADSPPPCPLKSDLWALLDESHGDVPGLPHSFCLSMSHLIFGREGALYAFMQRLACGPWACASDRAVPALARQSGFGYSRAAEAAVHLILDRFAGGSGGDSGQHARYGALHVRRDDRRQYLDCTNVAQVFNATARAVELARAAGDATANMTWFVFVKGEAEFADELRGNLTARGVLTRVVVESELTEVREAARLPAGNGSGEERGVIDNYFVMRVIHWLVQHATISVRSSSSNDWLWGHEQQERGGGEGGGSEKVHGGGGWTVDKWGRGRWVHYLCHESSNCIDRMHSGVGC